jgi:hypothetical protein
MMYFYFKIILLFILILKNAGKIYLLRIEYILE